MKLENNWRYKSLQNLQNITVEDPANAPTRLVARCLELLKTPLNEYTVEDLRLMIGQEFGLIYLIPLAIEKLNEDLFIEGDLYPGDLLSNVLNIDPAFWLQNEAHFKEMGMLIADKREMLIAEGISLKRFEGNF